MKNSGLPHCSLTLAVTLNSIFLVCGIPGVSIGNIKFGDDKIVDNSYENVNSKIYNIITSVNTNNGKCMKQVYATGNGIGDVFEMPCNANGVYTVTSKNVLMYGNPKEDRLFLFSNEASKLIVFQDGKCSKRTYKTVTRKTFGEEVELSKEECKNIEDKINFIQFEASKYIVAMAKHIRGKMPELSTAAQGALSKKSETSKASNPNPRTYSVTRGLSQEHHTLNKESENHQDIPHNGVTATEYATDPASANGPATDPAAANGPATDPAAANGPAKAAEETVTSDTKHKVAAHHLGRFKKWHF